MVDKKRIEKAVTEFLYAIGENPNRAGLKQTPKRVANMYNEIFSGIDDNPQKHVVLFDEDSINNDVIVVKNIPVNSMCEHHLLPFIGVAHIAYIPDNGKIIGLSKFARIIDTFSKRPQLQERLTSQIADFLNNQLKPQAILVIIQAQHTCMTMRGVKATNAKTTTSALRGSKINDTDIVNRLDSLLMK